MRKRKIFISSVQAEFAGVRSALAEYLYSDALLGKFFEPFLFEQLPAVDNSMQNVYLEEVERCDIYLGLLGQQYGYEDTEGISPTEREFDRATSLHKTRFIFLAQNNQLNQHPKQKAFIDKVQHILVRKQFSSIETLKVAVYSTLIKYLEEKEIIRTRPFDATIMQSATLNDIDAGKLTDFVRLAKSKRGFPLSETASVEKILTHLDLFSDGNITNAALLMFGKKTQHFFINSEIRCAYFLGNEVVKPISSYKVYKGTAFELVDQAVEFVLSKLDYAVETRSEHISIPGAYEIPKEIVAEAIVNAVAHRDYTSNGSIQVMLFKDRLEIWNPGSLPFGWTTQKLKILHSSVPANPLLAEPLYLAGYIERLGTGTSDIVRIAKECGLKEPEFVQSDDFKAIIYRKQVSGEVSGEVTGEVSGQVTGQVSGQVTGQVPLEVLKVILVLEGEMKRSEMQQILQLKHDDYFRVEYILPALESGVIEQKYPESPNHPQQRYKLTEKGLQLRLKFKK